MDQSYETYLKVFNKSNVDIVYITIEEIDNYDWDGDSRPDHNFQNESIKAGAFLVQREEVNARAKSGMFKMILRFEDGNEIAFRADQTYAKYGDTRIETKNYVVDELRMTHCYTEYEVETNYTFNVDKSYSGFGKYELTRKRESDRAHGTMVITVTGNKTAKTKGDKLEKDSQDQQDKLEFVAARQSLKEAIQSNPNDAKHYNQKLEKLNSIERDMNNKLVTSEMDVNSLRAAGLKLYELSTGIFSAQLREINENVDRLQNQSQTAESKYNEAISVANRFINEARSESGDDQHILNNLRKANDEIKKSSEIFTGSEWHENDTKMTKLIVEISILEEREKIALNTYSECLQNLNRARSSQLSDKERLDLYEISLNSYENSKETFSGAEWLSDDVQLQMICEMSSIESKVKLDNLNSKIEVLVNKGLDKNDQASSQQAFSNALDVYLKITEDALEFFRKVYESNKSNLNVPKEINCLESLLSDLSEVFQCIANGNNRLSDKEFDLAIEDYEEVSKTYRKITVYETLHNGDLTPYTIADKAEFLIKEALGQKLKNMTIQQLNTATSNKISIVRIPIIGCCIV